MATRSASEKRELLALIRAHLADGAPEHTQLVELEAFDVSLRELRGLRAEILSEEIDSVTTETAAEVFIRYRLRMEKCVGQLDDLVNRATAMSTAVALNAAVGAVKAKAQILNEVLDRGQSLGVVHKAQKEPARIAGIIVSDASLSDLKRLVRKRTAALEALAERAALRPYADEVDERLYYDAEVIGVEDVDSEVIDVEPSPAELPEDAPVLRTKVVA